MLHQDIDLHSAITALSCSLDLVGIDEIRHGKRVAMMAYHIAGELNWPEIFAAGDEAAGRHHAAGAELQL